jgi:20S proteasome subunit beta 2
MGSGSLAAMAVFETGWRPNVEVMFCPCVTAMMLIALQRDEALALVTRAVSAGIVNDLGSGSIVDAYKSPPFNQPKMALIPRFCFNAP